MTQKPDSQFLFCVLCVFCGRYALVSAWGSEFGGAGGCILGLPFACPTIFHQVRNLQANAEPPGLCGWRNRRSNNLLEISS
jgi:hypothetical protein